MSPHRLLAVSVTVVVVVTPFYATYSATFGGHLWLVVLPLVFWPAIVVVIRSEGGLQAFLRRMIVDEERSLREPGTLSRRRMGRSLYLGSLAITAWIGSSWPDMTSRVLLVGVFGALTAYIVLRWEFDVFTTRYDHVVDIVHLVELETCAAVCRTCSWVGCLRTSSDQASEDAHRHAGRPRAYVEIHTTGRSDKGPPSAVQLRRLWNDATRCGAALPE